MNPPPALAAPTPFMALRSRGCLRTNARADVSIVAPKPAYSPSGPRDLDRFASQETVKLQHPMRGQGLR